MLKLKLYYFGHLMRRANSLEKTLLPGKIEGQRRRGQQSQGQLIPFLQLHFPPTLLILQKKKRKTIDLALRKLMSSLVTFFPQITLTGCKLAVYEINLTGR